MKEQKKFGFTTSTSMDTLHDPQAFAALAAQLLAGVRFHIEQDVEGRGYTIDGAAISVKHDPFGPDDAMVASIELRIEIEMPDA